MPGFDPNLKVQFLAAIQDEFEVQVVVSSRDLTKPRIRGDHQVFYNRETLCLIDRLLKLGIRIDGGVVTMIAGDQDTQYYEKIEAFLGMSMSENGLTFKKHYLIPNYPEEDALDQREFLTNERVCQNDKRKKKIIVSPGGGSGKFGVCLSELGHDFREGRVSTYLKFETFPVFDLPMNHYLNRAFIAATADLGNTLVLDSAGYTSYDKDMQNFMLLVKLLNKFPDIKKKNPMAKFKAPSCMAVNRIRTGIIDMSAVEEASSIEIKRRIKRYREEFKEGIETYSALHNSMLLV